MVKRRSVTVVGDYTDLMVLLLHHLGSRYHVIFLQTASKILNIRPYSIGKSWHRTNAISSRIIQLASLFMKPNEGDDDVNKHGQKSCTTVSLEIALTLKRRARSVSRWRPGQSICLMSLSHQPEMQPSTTVTRCTTRNRLARQLS